VTWHSRRSPSVLVVLLGSALLAGSAAGDEAPFRLRESDHLQNVSTAQVQRIIESGEGPVIIDARGPGEFERGHLPGALNVPHKETWGRIEELRKYEEDQGIIYYCVMGGRAKIAGKGLLKEGFRKVGVMGGHLRKWKAEGRPLEQ
jgi:rhodanese-related sulfurtransferase